MLIFKLRILNSRLTLDMVVYLSETSNVKVRLSQKRKKREPAVPVLTYGGAPKITLFQLDALGALWCLTYQECLGPFTWSRSAPPNVFNLFGVCPFRSASVLSPDRAAHLPVEPVARRRAAGAQAK